MQFSVSRMFRGLAFPQSRTAIWCDDGGGMLCLLASRVSNTCASGCGGAASGRGICAGSMRAPGLLLLPVRMTPAGGPLRSCMYPGGTARPRGLAEGCAAEDAGGSPEPDTGNAGMAGCALPGGPGGGPPIDCCCGGCVGCAGCCCRPNCGGGRPNDGGRGPPGGGLPGGAMPGRCMLFGIPGCCRPPGMPDGCMAAETPGGCMLPCMLAGGALAPGAVGGGRYGSCRPPKPLPGPRGWTSLGGPLGGPLGRPSAGPPRLPKGCGGAGGLPPCIGDRGDDPRNGDCPGSAADRPCMPPGWKAPPLLEDG